MHRATHALLLLVIIGTTSFLTDGAIQPHQYPHGDGCFPDERAALLSFRKGITNDSAGVLASWRGQDCCRWRGIKCSNRTGHVIKLHLRNPVPDIYDDPCADDNGLFGEISSSLVSLKHLEHMDLSMNCLPGPNSDFPHLLGSMGNLRYLNLSGIRFTGTVPPQLGNLSKLQYLDIAQLFDFGGFSNMYSPDVTWLATLPKLKYLDMSGINLSGRDDWPHTLNMLPLLTVLRLASCSLGTANQSLAQFNLTKLETLDLGFNYLDHTIASGWFWKATSIKYLNLTYNSLLGQLPNAIGNMTSLHVLDLSRNLNEDMVITRNLENVCSLEILDISGNNMNGDIAVLVEALPKCAWKQLQMLNFGNNNFTGTLLEAWNLLEKFTNLNTLDLYGNNLTGSIPCGIGALTNLQSLDLSFNKFSGSVSSEIGALSNLAYLDLSYNNFSGSVLSEIGALTNLAYLHLSSNNFSGSLPSEIGSLTNLASLDLGYNKFSGSVPSEISGLTNLTYLILRNNNFSGLITEKNLESLQSLKVIDLSSNNLKVVVDPDWNHPFNLDYAAFAHCQMGPKFPAWLERQPEIIQLNISNTGLKDKIPDWFWSTVSYVEYLDISYNQISGSLPAHLRDMSFYLLNLRSNQFTGPLPRLPVCTILDISSNAFSGTLPSFPEDLEELTTLLMSSNKFGGEIPESLCKLVHLEYLDLSNNILEGKIPQCFEVESMTHLLLSNNSLSGTFPAFLKKCTDLEFLDLSWNKFHGRLPSWIGELGGLHILRLGHNVFSGTIPVSMANLSNLQYLDLSSNNISGVIPRHLSNLTSMTLKGFTPIELCSSLWPPVDYSGNDVDFVNCGQFGDILSIITKGQRLSYGGSLAYFVGIDLSDNSLTGGIPTDITYLDAAISLNLSSNHLSGKIPNEIGSLHSLESLDLSMNKLSGEIPSSVSSLTSLSYLNLSYNNLSGRIPSGRQLDTLNVENPALMYIGNKGLCGPPLQKNCSGNDTGIHGHVRSNNHEEFELMTFYFGLVLGLVAGLWSVFCAFLFKKTWRTAFFQLFDELYDRIYVYVVVKWKSFIRKTDENEQID